ncbi:MAG TPA: TetR/AcrR family transcriptional regulator [Solirubrobacteraceae bacterium]|jgi:AcrR family transcriptional regulator/DNA-binding MarR family transcriptional regulator
MREAERERRRTSGGPRHRVASGGQRHDEGIVSLQRTRLLRSAVALLAEHGYASVSVAAICAHAGVSRKTYYEIFENREECLAAILIDAEATVQGAIAGAVSVGWRERIRSGLWAILCLADGEPALARVCLGESARPGGLAGVERKRILAQLAGAVDQGRLENAQHGGLAGALTAEALVGAVSAVLAARLGSAGGGNARHARLQELLGELMSMIVLPYLGPAAARRELTRPAPQTLAAETPNAGIEADGPDPLVGSSMRLTYRTARVLMAVAQLGDARAGASNRQIAEHAGVADQGQISKLLSRLESYGLLVNEVKDSAARGEANRWTLTHAGRRLVHGIGALEAERVQRSAA